MHIFFALIIDKTVSVGSPAVDLDRGRVGRYRLLSDGGMIDVL
jgi:hypothetical protein